MSDFVQTMKDWRRMCNTIQSKNQKASIGSWCKGCPLQDFCIIDTSIKDTTNGEFDIIGEQIQAWAAENPEPVYPSIAKYFKQFGITIRRDGSLEADYFKANEPMSADMAKLLGISSGDGENEKTD